MLYMGSSEFIDWLNLELERRNWSYRELGRRASLSSGAISKVMTEAALPGWELCKRVAQALDKPPEQIFRLAGLLPPVPEKNARLQEANLLFNQLSDQEQEFMLVQIRALLLRKDEKHS
jgi:transcriptional regulator with XRE-family HTH domain